ncbi:MAG: nucleotide exchange factor GrpE [bacterium]
MKKANSSNSKNGNTNNPNENNLENNEREIPVSSPGEVNNQEEIPEKNEQPEENISSALEKERDELKEKVLRTAAELENMRRRVLKEKNELIEYANHNLFLKLLPLMDDFENAIKSGKSSEDYQSLMQGIELIYNKAVKIFEDAGVKKLDIQEGDPFNVDYHEAILKMPSENVEEDGIISVAENGYMIYDKVLRHAKVITSEGKTKEN